MNRIRELRELAGLTGEELARLCKTTSAQIYKLERGERRLTADWMGRIAEALGTSPAALIQNAVMAALEDDVAELSPVELDRAIAADMATRGLVSFRVVGRSVIGAGISPGDRITVDTSQEAIDAIETGDIVLVQLEQPAVRALRGVYVTADVTLLLTVRDGANITISTNDLSVRPRIIGVAVRKPHR